MLFPDIPLHLHRSLLLTTAVVMLAVPQARADIGEIGQPGAKPVPIEQLAQEKRIRDQVLKVLQERATQRKATQSDAAEKAAVEQDKKERAAGTNAQDLSSNAAAAKGRRGTKGKGQQDKPPTDQDAATGQSSAPVDHSADLDQNGAPKVVKADDANAAALMPVPSLVILFNRNHVDFERELRHLLQDAERSNKVSHYDVISEVPTTVQGGRRNGRVTSEYENNLKDVINKFAELGVQSSRITVQTRPSDKITAQSISIFQN